MYHRRVYVIDLDNVPVDGPVLLCPNHPGAFLDACMIGTYSRRDVYFLTRGDFFKGGMSQWFLEASHQIPIFRASDGMRNLRSNLETFYKCFEYLNKERQVLIFPEARTELEKRLRPLHKGAARIALGAHEKYPGVFPVIVPVGVTFDDPRYFGRDAYFKFGEPIDVREYMEVYENDYQKALQQVTDRIEASLKANMIHLDTPEAEAVFNKLIILLDEDPAPFPRVSQSVDQWQWQKNLAAIVNAMPADQIEYLYNKITGLEAGAKGAGLPFHVLGRLARSEVNGFETALLYPVELFGLSLEYIPYWITRRYVLSRVKRLPFIAPMKSILGFFIHVFYYLFIAIILSIFLGSNGFLLGIVVALSGYFSLSRLRDANFVHWLRWRSLSQDDKEAIRNSIKEVSSSINAVAPVGAT